MLRHDAVRTARNCCFVLLLSISRTLIQDEQLRYFKLFLIINGNVKSFTHT